MRKSSIRIALASAWVLMSLSAGLRAQGWDAAAQARGWAKQDKDDSFTFHDAGARMLRTWMRDGGVMGSTSTAKVDGTPTRWAMDPRNNAWVAHGNVLTQVDRSGKVITNVKLPAEVGDLCWDTKGIVLSYRSPEPYLEKRDFKGSVLWTFGTKPAKDEDGAPPQNRRPVVMDDAGKVILADGGSLNLSVLDGESGRKLLETQFRLPGGQPVPTLEGRNLDRGPLVLWSGRGVVFAAVTAAQIPAAHRESLQGLALARLDLGQSRLEFLPTGLDEQHFLVGLLDGEAIFVSPKGGLVLVKVR